MGVDGFDWTDSQYKPNYFEDGVLLKKPIPNWACDMNIKHATLDARQTYYMFDFRCPHTLKPLSESRVPYDHNHGRYLNPGGKTGLIGRGVLGWFGPNHAADNIVTREHGPHFQVLLVEKHQNDGVALAFPAGMVEPGMDVVTTLKKKLTEEAVESGDAVNQLFETCKQNVVYSGIVDDYRNTDWAWIETTAVWFHATTLIGSLELRVKDKEEIRGVRWVNIEDVTEMYASHMDWLNIVKENLRRRAPFSSHDKAHLTTMFVSHYATVPQVAIPSAAHASPKREEEPLSKRSKTGNRVAEDEAMGVV